MLKNGVINIEQEQNFKNSQTKFTNTDLKHMQSWDLDKKIVVSLTKIVEFYSKFPHKIYVLYILIIIPF